MVPMMKMEDMTTPYFRDEEMECTVVEMNYIGYNKAIFILPDQGKIKQVEASLQPATLKKWRKSLRPRCMSSGPRIVIDPCTEVVLIASVLVPQNLTYIQCHG